MSWRIAILVVLAIGAVFAALSVAPVAQNPAYHAFADRRTLLGIPNFWNVVSNVPFLLAGLYGLYVWRGAQWRESVDRWPWLILAVASCGIAFGSGYYHAWPDNRTLFWDRLPMTLGFMSILAAMIGERIHARAGFLLLLPFLVLGLLSIEVWRRGELTGVGDLRFYGLVQFYPMLALPVILLLFPARYTHGRGLWTMGALYLLAKLLELADVRVFRITQGMMSGHTLKHIVAALSLLAVFEMLHHRRPIPRL
ncbi:MAG: alkaline phytoceramidase [Acidobacteria bacterium]|nr:alkaline phytoceramidase [Acidobacteriota bacterium]